MAVISATFHPLSYVEFFGPLLADYPGLDTDILQAFTEYKATGRASGIIGRDAPYVEPYAAFRANLMHIHLKLPPGEFPKNLPQIDRVCRKGQPHKDAALVYVKGELEEYKYCLLAVLYPSGHAKAREEKIMRYLARLAQQFRDEN
ncbi:type II toxin-antitoxin system YafO family toxin [Pseudomonas cannabina]|uniref:type II toxin-antitoxin system YafO family toxin n=1 Tax=Pseudomonas syringae group TaxID=136849 RepID=UPI0006B8F38A|nr:MULTISPECIES: type II toxin-antitoxin system YafO family toxin [Pseudomonas syringae group]QQN20991.1 type II toxin-antitoxin system YafO family toxin [Pseudomonas cannabina pv. alisalensis]